MTPAEITQHFYLKIPISRELGIQVLEVSGRHARVTAPLKPNLNHVGTVFGGSLYSVAALSCYALFQALSKEAGGLSDELVIQEGKINYKAPITADFEVRAQLVSPGDDQRFIEGLRRHGKARLSLRAEILCGDKVGAIFEGIYVFKS